MYKMHSKSELHVALTTSSGMERIILVRLVV